MSTILIQAAFCVVALLFAHFQIPIVKAFRDYVPINNPYNASFKKRSVALIGFISALLIIAFILSSQIANPVVIILKAALLIPLFVAWYKILFDGLIGWKVYDDFFYLGTTSKQDRWIANVFEFTGAGEAKCIICGIVIIAINLIL